MGIRIKQTRVETLPVGEYSARISAIEEAEGQFGPQLKFWFDITEPGHEGKQLVGWTSQKFSPKSKLYAWTRAAFGGRAIPENWDFDSDALVGRSVRLEVVVKQSDDGEYNRINAVRPSLEAGSQKAERPAPQPQAVHSEPGLPPFEPHEEDAPPLEEDWPFID